MPDPHGKKAGIITKPYGLKGKLNLVLEPGAGEEIKEGDPLFVDIDGQRVPFFVELVEQGSQNHLIIQFEFVDTIDKARKVSGCEVYLETDKTSDASDNHITYDRLLGYTVIDVKVGRIGAVSGYMPHDFNPVFIVEYGPSEVMIPASDQLIDHIDHETHTILFRLPDGLIDL